VDLFKMGMRNLFGVMLPGALPLMVAAFVLATTPVISGLWCFKALWAGSHEVLTIAVFFLLSYLLGSLLRLNSAKDLDIESGGINQKRTLSEEQKLPHFNGKDTLDEIWMKLSAEPAGSPTESKDAGLWAYDTFPYPVFQLQRIKRLCPRSNLAHLEPLLDRMRLSPLPDRGRMAPFNYCKMHVYAASKEVGQELISEIRSAETEVRFFAGTYYALLWSMCILSVPIAFHIAYFFVNHRDWQEIFRVIILIVVALLTFVANRKILVRFRTLRIREVDLVLDAYALCATRNYFAPRAENE
jgi:hypothetical protein